MAQVKPSSSNLVKQAFVLWDTCDGPPSDILRVVKKELKNVKKLNIEETHLHDAVLLGEFLQFVKGNKEAH